MLTFFCFLTSFPEEKCLQYIILECAVVMRNSKWKSVSELMFGFSCNDC